MSILGFAIVPTVLGAFGAAWSEAGIVRTWLHERTPERARLAIRRAMPTAEERTPPDAIAGVLSDVAALLGGEPRTLDVAELDMRAIAPFDRRVYEVARAVPPGETITYGAIASALGEEPMVARDVGRALAHNPYAPIVPCHRVVAAGGKLGGYTAPGGAMTKRRLLELEGAAIVATEAPTATVDRAPEQGGFFD